MPGAPAIPAAITTTIPLLFILTLPTSLSLLVPPSLHLSHPHPHKIRNWILGFLAGTISGLLFSLLLHLLRRHLHHLSQTPSTKIFSPSIPNNKALSFLHSPDPLSHLPIIGRGASGHVHLHHLPSLPIAIKRIRKTPNQNPDEISSRRLDKFNRQIQSEIKTVSRIRHRYLLPLHAHVSRPDSDYLIYNYMPNGSLHDAIRNNILPWPTRQRIASGIASGLEHLHFHHRPRIIHRDLKPDNILLDEELEAKISDFGFAKEMAERDTHLTMSHMAGTVGYIAPEYYQTMKYTAKCDVYSLGVILGVIVMGRFPSDEFFCGGEEMGLVRWMRKQVGVGNWKGCFDGRIAGDGRDDGRIELVLRVACFCTADDPAEWPSSRDVRVMLGQIDQGG